MRRQNVLRRRQSGRRGRRQSARHANRWRRTGLRCSEAEGTGAGGVKEASKGGAGGRSKW